MQAKFIAIAFVDAINSRDRNALVQLMAVPCLVDKLYSAPLPDYQIHVESIIADCDMVVLIGQAKSYHETIPAVWIAQLCGQRITDWRAYFDGQSSCHN